MRRRPPPVRECGKILTLLYEAWLCFLTLLVEGLPLKFNTGWCVCKFDTVTPEPKWVRIGHVTRKCITKRSLYVNVSSGQVTKRWNARTQLTPPSREARGFFFLTWICGASATVQIKIPCEHWELRAFFFRRGDVCGIILNNRCFCVAKSGDCYHSINCHCLSQSRIWG